MTHCLPFNLKRKTIYNLSFTASNLKIEVTGKSSSGCFLLKNSIFNLFWPKYLEKYHRHLDKPIKDLKKIKQKTWHQTETKEFFEFRFDFLGNLKVEKT